MTNPFPFLEMFFEYQPDESLRAVLQQAAVCHAEFDREAHEIALTVNFPQYTNQLRRVCEELQELYQLRKVKISPKFPKEALADIDGKELNRLVSMEYSPATGIMAGCRWELAEGTSKVHLRANGRELIEPHMHVVQRYLKESFGVETQIEIISHQHTDDDELFELTERMRREAVKQMPAPKFTSENAKPDKPKTAFGKPFQGKATAMREISSDMQNVRVIIEGKVFAVDHRRNRKDTATIVSFDMTDYTGSVHLGGFFKEDTGKPITDFVQKPGQWLRVQGRVDYDEYSKEEIGRASCRERV